MAPLKTASNLQKRTMTCETLNAISITSQMLHCQLYRQSGATCTMRQKVFLQRTNMFIVFLSTKMEVGKYVMEFDSKHLQLINFVLFLWLQRMQSQLWVLEMAFLTGAAWALAPGRLKKSSLKQKEFESSLLLGILLVICAIQQPSQTANQNHLLSKEAWAKRTVTFYWGQTLGPLWSQVAHSGAFRKKIKGK